MAGIFDRKLTIAELQKRLSEFSTESARLAVELDRAQARVSLLLARNEDASKALQLATGLQVALNARPAALAALNRELRRLQREQEAAGWKKNADAVRAWAKKLGDQGEKLILALNGFGKELSGWLELAAAAPQEAGPGGGLLTGTIFRDMLLLRQLPDILAKMARDGAAGPAQLVVQQAVEAVRAQGTGLLESKLGDLRRAEAGDPEPALDLEPVGAAGASR